MSEISRDSSGLRALNTEFPAKSVVGGNKLKKKKKKIYIPVVSLLFEYSFIWLYRKLGKDEEQKMKKKNEREKREKKKTRNIQDVRLSFVASNRVYVRFPHARAPNVYIFVLLFACACIPNCACVISSLSLLFWIFGRVCTFARRSCVSSRVYRVSEGE